ncbi:hypothetical protein K504DRAFT_498342 [Pleomassaria siparia CBS 279.74]|uniref:Uncharacterized protein n=1 Tax=Pleomassaria siparia CBS 279.74 TaxID=1314801 RepID=A0A6G1KM21_9PLEO|nr:hypothetical protein K504DRAFT_498342 [Pleomassaria siparia CBS 279.74]
MPSYSPTDVTMHLSTAVLSETTTSSIIVKKGLAAAGRSDAAQTKLKQGVFLSEERVQFPGDVRNFSLNYIGNVPFKQVKVGPGLERLGRASMMPGRVSPKNEEQRKEKSEVSVAGRNVSRGYSHSLSAHSHDSCSSSDITGSILPQPSRLSGIPPSISDNEVVPKALALHVLLSEKSFLRNPNTGKPQRLMIDVLLNGMLVSSNLVDIKDTHTYHQVFAGTRVENMAERPWVVLPPGQNADGSLRGLKRTVSAKERWAQICSAIREEARERGINESDERPPSAEYLKTLASMPMSDTVESLQQPGGRQFGIVDVVITAGDGRKLNDGAAYLKKPQRLSDARYGWREEECATELSRQSSEQDAEGETDDEYKQEILDVRENLRADQPTTVANPWPSMPMLPPALLPEYQGLTQPSSLPFLPLSAALPGMNYAYPLHQDVPTWDPNLVSMSNSPPLFSQSAPLLGATYPVLEPSHQPNQARQVSLGNTCVTGNNSWARTSLSSKGLGTSDHAVYSAEEDIHEGDISPLAHQAFGACESVHFRGNSLDPHFGRPLPGPPPPVGFFSALPHFKQKSPAAHATVDPSLPPLSFHLKRLIITGKGGIPIVDHSWRYPQRIAVSRSDHRRQHLPTKARQTFPGSAEYTELAAASRSGSRTIQHLRTPPPTSPQRVDLNFTTSVDKIKRDSVHDSHLVRDPYCPPIIGPALASVSETLSVRPTQPPEDAEMIVDDDDAASPNTPAIIGERRGHMSCPGLGIQGPKATPFIYEDPEDLLRKRTKSPRKSDGRPATVTSASLPETARTLKTRSNTSATCTAATKALAASASTVTTISDSSELRKAATVSDFNLVDYSSSLSSAPNSPELSPGQFIGFAPPYAVFSSLPGLSGSSSRTLIQGPESHPSVPMRPVCTSDLQSPMNRKRCTSSLSSVPSNSESVSTKFHTVISAKSECASQEIADISFSVSKQSVPFTTPAYAPRRSPAKRRRVSSVSSLVDSPGRSYAPAIPTQGASTSAKLHISNSNPRLFAPRQNSPTRPSISPTRSSTESQSQSLPKKRRRIIPQPALIHNRAWPRPPPERADTSDNPPLNQDCVIAYAVGGPEKRVLRQVKCERQGNFKEDEVVVGMRFFVAG